MYCAPYLVLWLENWDLCFSVAKIWKYTAWTEAKWKDDFYLIKSINMGFSCTLHFKNFITTYSYSVHIAMRHKLKLLLLWQKSIYEWKNDVCCVRWNWHRDGFVREFISYLESEWKALLLKLKTRWEIKKLAFQYLI